MRRELKTLFLFLYLALTHPNTYTMKYFFQLVIFSFFLASCGKSTTSTIPFEEADYQDIAQDLQTRLIMAEPGDTIVIPQGHYVFKRSLTLEGKDSITIMGAGMDKTILSFHMQTEGAEGLRIQNGNQIVLKGLTIRDAVGDNIKIQDINGLSLINVKSEWTGEPEATNGAYAIYPVMCRNVLIEGCVAIGASDAGIYVGQSDNVIVRNSKAFNNVAGIEIENTTRADVYNNEAFDNTGGILVFDLPGLSQLGGNVRVFDNQVSSNNFRNFAPKGNIVASVPPGTGVMVLATQSVEIFNNKVTDNRTAGVSVISYEFVMAAAAMDDSNSGEAQMSQNEAAYKADQAYNPIPSAIFIHDNAISNSFTLPSLESDIGYLLMWQFGLSIPDILWDGVAGEQPGPILCLEANGEASFANLDAANDFANSNRDIAGFSCSGKAIAPVTLENLLSAL